MQPDMIKHTTVENFVAEYNAKPDWPMVRGEFERREIRPEFIAFHWQRTNGGSWRLLNPTAIYGRYVLKDGSPGQELKRYAFWRFEQLPEWVQELIKEVELP